MIEVTAPEPIVGDLLHTEIADAGVAVEEVVAVGGYVRVVGATEDDRAAIDDVVAAHDPSGFETDEEKADRQFRDAVNNANSVAALKDALLGGTDNPGAESRRSGDA